MIVFCRCCGRSIDVRDNISWKYFGFLCGSCFLPWADYFLKNLDWMEAEEKLSNSSPVIHCEA